MAHKFGIVAINEAGKVYLTRDMNDANCKYPYLKTSLALSFSYGTAITVEFPF